MGSRAHHKVSIGVQGAWDGIFLTHNLFVGADHVGQRSVMKWTIGKASAKGLYILEWLSKPKYDYMGGWEGEVLVARK